MVPARKRQDETNDVQINRNRKREGEEKIKISQHQQGKEEDNAQGEYAYSGSQGARGGV